MENELTSKLKKFYELNKGITKREIDFLKIDKYIEKYLKWNSVTSLSTLNDIDDIFTKHFLDSFSLDLIFKNETIVDIGSGAGFPGLAYALYNPEIKLISIEKNRKKINFQKTVIAELKIKNVEAIETTLEEFLKNKALQNIDYFVFRAVEKRENIFKVLVEAPVAKQIIYMSSGNISDRNVKDIKFEKAFPYSLPGVSGQRELLKFAK